MAPQTQCAVIIESAQSTALDDRDAVIRVPQRLDLGAVLAVGGAEVVAVAADHDAAVLRDPEPPVQFLNDIASNQFNEIVEPPDGLDGVEPAVAADPTIAAPQLAPDVAAAGPQPPLVDAGAAAERSAGRRDGAVTPSAQRSAVQIDRQNVPFRGFAQRPGSIGG